MRRLIVVAALCLLAGCAGVPPTKTVYETKLAYDTTVLTPAVHYAELPFCADGVHFTLAAPCSEKTAVIALNKANLAAREALAAAQDVVDNHPTVDSSFAIVAAQNAIKAVGAIMALYAPGFK